MKLATQNSNKLNNNNKITKKQHIHYILVIDRVYYKFNIAKNKKEQTHSIQTNNNNNNKC
jgi:hypothetical protein